MPDLYLICMVFIRGTGTHSHYPGGDGRGERDMCHDRQSYYSVITGFSDYATGRRNGRKKYYIN